MLDLLDVYLDHPRRVLSSLYRHANLIKSVAVYQCLNSAFVLKSPIHTPKIAVWG